MGYICFMALIWLVKLQLEHRLVGFLIKGPLWLVWSLSWSESVLPGMWMLMLEVHSGLR